MNSNIIGLLIVLTYTILHPPPKKKKSPSLIVKDSECTPRTPRTVLLVSGQLLRESIGQFPFSDLVKKAIRGYAGP